MRFLKIAFVAFVLPLVVTACQTKSTATSTYAGSNLGKPGKKVSKTNGKKGIRALVAKHARANGVPVKLAMAVVQVESNFRVNARGSAGEIGLMQILPRTARGIGYKGSMKALYNPDTNLKYGMKYLGGAYRRGGKSTCGTILKYNAGHYAKRMNRISANYCRKVKRILART